MGDRFGGRTARTLAVPAAALADGDTLDLANDGKLPFEVGINSVWVLVAGILVMFMQAGFAFLEIGFSRGKNAGTVVAKILVNFSIAALCFYAVGFAFAFGDGNQIIGTCGFFLAGADASANFPLINVAEGTITSRRCGSSSSSSAPSRWRSSGAPRSSASSSAST